MLDRSRLRWLLRGSVALFLGPLLFYYFHDRAPGWVETAILGQRLLQVALPLWVVAYAGVLDDWVAPPLRRWMGPTVWTAAVAAGCVGLLAANGVAFAKHQARLVVIERTRDQIIKQIHEDSVIVFSGGIYKFVGTPLGLPYYRLRPLDWMGYEVDPPEALDRDLAAETRPWFVAVLKRKADDRPYPLAQALIDRHRLRRLPLDTPLAELYSSGPPGP